MPTPDEMIDRLLDAAISYEQAQGPYADGCRVELGEARASCMAAMQPTDPTAFALVSAYESGHAAGRADLLRELGLTAQERSGIYVASRASIPERAAMWRALRSSGHPIISTWIDEDGPGQTADYAELWQRIANEIASARLLVLYAEPEDFPLKGALTEVGIAIGGSVPVRVVLPGVTMEGRTFRPVGSWIKHPMVTICDTVEEAFSALQIVADLTPEEAAAKLREME